MKPKIIAQGAEANIIRSGDFIIKDRIAKGYRLKELDDKIRRTRARREAKIMIKASKIVNCPEPFFVPQLNDVKMPFVDGLKLSESLDSMKNWKEVCFKIGEGIGKLHDEGIIHGDLTTSNLIWVEGKLDSSSLIGGTRSTRSVNKKTDNGDGLKDVSGITSGKLYFIDFGLGYQNGRTEDKAVDLHLIKQALEAKHFGKWEEYFAEILRGYKKSNCVDDVLKRLEKVEKRGRYKS